FTSGSANLRLLPMVQTLSPPSVNPGASTTPMIINGFNFVAPGTRVSLRTGGNINDKPLNATVVNSTTISAFILPVDLATGGAAQVIVSNPQPCGGQSVKEFLVINPKPEIASVAPNLAKHGSGGGP